MPETSGGEALKAAGKQLDRETKKQVKADSKKLQRLADKCQIGKATEEQLQEMRNAREQLEKSAASILHRGGEE